MCSHAFWGMHAWLPESICKSVNMWVSLLLYKRIHPICVYLMRNLDCRWCCGDKHEDRGIMLEGIDWPFSLISRLS